MSQAPTPTTTPRTYAKAITAVAGTLIATLVAATSSGSPFGAWQLATAIALALLGDATTYAVRNGHRGAARYAKAIASWVSALAAAAPLAVHSYEGAHGLSSLRLGDLSPTGWLVLLVLVARALLVGIIPNAVAALEAGDVAGLERAVLDIRPPVQAASGGRVVPTERLDTQAMTALTPQILAQMDAAAAAAKTKAARKR